MVLSVAFRDLVDVEDSIARAESQKLSVRRKSSGVQGLDTVLEKAINFSRVRVQHHPLPAGHGNHNNLAVLRKARGLGLILRNKECWLVKKSLTCSSSYY